MAETQIEYQNTKQALDINFFNSHMKELLKSVIEISSAGFSEDNSIVLKVAFGDELETSIVIRPLQETDNYFLCTDRIAFCFLGNISPTPVPFEYFMKYLQKRLAGVSYDKFFKQCRKDDLEYLGKCPEGADDDIEREYYGWKEQWRTFFCRGALERNTYSTLTISNPKKILSIVDKECSYSYLPMSPNLVHFHNYPGIQRTTAYQKNCRRHLVVEISENDLIMGTRPKIKKALGKLTADTKNTELIYLNSTCVLHITGEDYEDIGCVAQEKCGIPVFYEGPKINEEANLHSSRMENYVRAEKEGGREKVAGKPSVNLVGFPDFSSIDEIRSMVETLGIEILTKLYPVIDIGDLKKAVGADLNIIYPCDFFINKSAALFESIDIPAISPPAPYGMKATYQWLSSAADFFDIGSSLQRTWNHYFDPVSEEWESLKKQAFDFRLAFVVDTGEMDLLLKPETYWGVKMLEAIDEMGFGIDILYYRDDEFDESRMNGQVEKAIEHPDRIRVSTFSDRESLYQLLTDGVFDAVYSDFVFDHRISSTGKPQFSLKDFDMGIRGAILTAERLLRICSLPFYKRFKHHLPERKL